MPLDHTKLANLKRTSEGFQAACPACRHGGADSTGEHLRLWSSGKFSCVLHPGDDVHNRIIWALAGGGASGEVDEALLAAANAAKQEIVIERTWDDSILDRLVKDNSYWHRRGISDETLAPFRGGLAMDGQMKGRFVFPIFDAEEQIIGFDGRHTWKELPLRPDGKPVPSWKVVGDKNRFVWGGLDEIVNADRAILVESIGDSLTLREQGVPESICLFGTFMSQAVLGYLIATNPAELIVSTNRDIKSHKAGQRAAERIADMLRTFFNPERVKIVFPPERSEGESPKDWGETTAEEIAAAFLTAPEAPAAESDSSDEDPTEEA